MHKVRAIHSSHELEPEVLYEGPDRARAREVLEEHFKMLQCEYADTAEREGGTMRATVSYRGEQGRPGVMVRARVSISGTNEDGWSRVVWTNPTRPTAMPSARQQRPALA